jgi:uncharacterized protein (DUF433 family)
MSCVVSKNPEVLGGEPVFAGTRVPAKSLFDHLEAGDSIEQFLEGFPSVKREQVIALRAKSNRLDDTRPLMNQLLAILPTSKLGTLTFIPEP